MPKGHYNRSPRSEETKARISATLTGRTLTQVTKDLISDSCRGRDGLYGKDNPNWNKGATARHTKMRNSLKYKMFKDKVLYRDNWTCVLCGENGTAVDHIKSFAFFPKLRYTLSNARTLCNSCHEKTDNYGYKAKKNSNSI